MSISSSELAELEARLEAEVMQVKKYAYYARIAADPKLKYQFEFNRVRHLNACEKLRSQIH